MAGNIIFLAFVGISISSSSDYAVEAFSAAGQPGDGIKIVGLPGGQIQSLPGMYVKTFRRWIVEENNNDSVECTADGTKSSGSASSLFMEPIYGAGVADLPYNEGWVNPTTTDELWWPKDLETLQTRPLLNVLFKSGVLSYVGVGLDVRFPQYKHGKDGSEVISWRNYGMNSQPISRIWTSLNIAMEKLFHVEGFILRGNNGKNFEILFPSINAQSVMQKVVTFVGEVDALSPIGEGFHIVSFPMTNAWVDIPNPEDGMQVDEESGEINGATFKIVCMATSEPFATKLLDMDEDLLTMSSTSVLEVEVSRTAKGKDSPYLPEPYKELYLS
ncbi:hypothetical protein ACHAXS_013738 [Conticribra weissflogii]